MPSILMAVVFLFSSPADWSSPEAAEALAAFEGEWSFTSSDWAYPRFANGPPTARAHAAQKKR